MTTFTIVSTVTTQCNLTNFNEYLDHCDLPEHLEHPAHLDTSTCRRNKNTLSQSYLGKVVRSYLRAMLFADLTSLTSLNTLTNMTSMTTLSNLNSMTTLTNLTKMTTLPSLQAGLTHLDYFHNLDLLEYPNHLQYLDNIVNRRWLRSSGWPSSQVVKVVNVIRAQVEVVN